MEAIERTSARELDGNVYRSAFAGETPVKIAAKFSVIYSLHPYPYGAKSRKIKELVSHLLDFPYLARQLA